MNGRDSDSTPNNSDAMPGGHRGTGPLLCSTHGGAVLAAVALTLATVGHAQSPDASNPAAPPPPEAGLQEIVVTAQRRSEGIQHVAADIDAVSAQELAKASVTSAADLTAVVPTLQVSNQGGFSAMYIRGIGSYSGNPYSEPAVAFNLDGVFVSRANAVNGQFFDLDRVEVLKGPQGTLYGRNATGGAINLISHAPDLGTSGGFLSATYGNYDSYLVSGALNAPLGDKAAARLAFQTEDHSGYMSDGTDDARNRSVRLSFRAEPDDDVSVKLIADYSHLGGRGTGVAILPLGTTRIRGGLGDPGAVAYYQNAAANSFINFGPNAPPYAHAVTPVPEYLSRLDTPIFGVMSQLDWRTPIGTVTFVPAYRRLSTDNFLMTIGSFAWDRTHQWQTSAEVRLASDNSGPFRYLFGAYYFQERSNFDLSFDSQFAGVITEQGDVTTRSPAAFSQLAYSLTPTIRLTGGVRYTNEHKGLDGTHSLSPPAAITSGPGLNPLFFLPGTPQIEVNASRRFTRTNWKGGLEWDVAPDSLLYATVSTGFKAGGFFFSGGNNSFQPENVTSYSIGSKNRFADNRLQVNAEAFWLKYRDQQFAHLSFVPGIDGPVEGYPTENVGRSTIKGIETEVRWLPVRTTELSADIQYADSRYDQFTFQTPDISGFVRAPPGTVGPVSGCPHQLSNTAFGNFWNITCTGYQLLQTPTWTVSGTLKQTFELANAAAITAELRAHYESSRWASDSFQAVSRIGGVGTADFNLTYDSGGAWFVTAFVNNITNRIIPGNVWANDVYPVFPLIVGTLRPPRLFGLRAQYNLSFASHQDTERAH